MCDYINKLCYIELNNVTLQNEYCHINDDKFNLNKIKTNMEINKETIYVIKKT